MNILNTEAGTATSMPISLPHTRTRYWRERERWASEGPREEGSTTDKHAFLSLIKTWALCAILLVLASTYGFSFERGSKNTTVGAAEQGVAAADAQESALIKAQKNGMYLVSILVMIPLARSVGAEFRRNLLVSCLLFWAVISCLWSMDAYASLVTALRMTLDVALAFYLMNRYSKNDLLKLLILVGSVAAAASILLIVFFPQYGLQGRDTAYAFGAWQGIFGAKNICGRMMTLLLLPVLFVKLDSRWARILRLFYVMVMLIIIAMTRSAGSWLLCGACLAFVAVIHLGLKLRRIDALSLAVASFGVIIAVSFAAFSNRNALLALVGKDPTMTGRTGIWATLMVSIMKHPFLGYGYFAFWQGLHGESANVVLQAHWPGMSYAENGILELWIEIGLVAVLLYGLIFLKAVRDAVFCLLRNPSRSTMWYLTLLFYVAFSNLWAGNLLTASNLECVIPFIAFAGLRKEARRIRGLQSL